MAGFTASGPPSTALGTAGAWLEGRLGTQSEDPEFFMREFSTEMTAEHDVHWQLRLARPRLGGVLVDVAIAEEPEEGIRLRKGKSLRSLTGTKDEPPSVHRLADKLGPDWSAPQSEAWIDLTFGF